MWEISEYSNPWNHTKFLNYSLLNHEITQWLKYLISIHLVKDNKIHEAILKLIYIIACGKPKYFFLIILLYSFAWKTVLQYSDDVTF